MATIKTRPTGEDVTAFLDSVPAERRRVEGHALRSLFERVTGEPAAMWGPSMIGFGAKPYTNTLGTNDWFVVGFSPRKAALTIYGIHNGYAAPDPLLDGAGSAHDREELRVCEAARPGRPRRVGTARPKGLGELRRRKVTRYGGRRTSASAATQSNEAIMLARISL